MDNNFNFGDDDLFNDNNQDSQSSYVDNIFNNANSTPNNDSDENLDFGDDFTDSSADTNSDNKLKKPAILIAAIGLVGILAVALVASLVGKEKEDDVEDSYTTSTNTGYVEHVDPNQLMNTQGNMVNNQVTTSDYSTWTELEQSQEIEFKDYIKTSFTVTGIKHYVRNSSPDGTFIIKTTLTGMLSGYSGTYTLDVPYNKGVIIDTNPDLGIGCTFDVSVLIGEYGGKLFIGDITTNIYE